MLWELLDRGEPAAPALVVPGGPRLTYQELRDEVRRGAEVLAGLGLRQDRAVAMVFENGPEAVVLFLAAAMVAGAAPLNPTYTEAELRFYLEDVAAGALVVPPGGAAAARAARPEGTVLVEAAVGAGRAGPAGGRRRGARAAHQRHHRAAQAGAAAPPQPDRLGRQYRRHLPARAGRRVAVRDAAVPRARAGGVGAVGAGDRRHRGGAGTVQPAHVLACAARAPPHLVLGRAHHPPHGAGPGPRRPARRHRDPALRPLVQRGPGA